MPLINIGQRTMKVFTLAKSGDPPDLLGFCEDGRFDCGFVLPVYANAGTNDLQNDKSSLLVHGTSFITAIAFVIQKNVAGTYVNQVTITDQTYGEYYPQGSSTTKPYHAWVILYWKNVLALIGAGEYRIKVTKTTPLGAQIVYSKPWCLKEYVCAPENTVRLEWWLNDGIGDIDDDRSILDFGDINLYNQVRIPRSIFGYPVSTYEVEQVQYSNGQFQDITTVQTEKYQLITGPLPAWLHNILKTYFAQGDDRQITDYSPNNPQEIIEKAVKLVSGYEPRWVRGAKCAPVTLEFEPTHNRLEKFKCL